VWRLAAFESRPTEGAAPPSDLYRAPARAVPKRARINVDIRDTRLPGFAIRCRASGVHSYLVLLGRRRVMTLGKVSVLTPHEARKAARLALADMAHGIDPTASTQQTRERGAPWRVRSSRNYGTRSARSTRP
jgi:Arm DNA-binding domain